jgi:hypothetical protein
MEETCRVNPARRDAAREYQEAGALVRLVQAREQRLLNRAPHLFV